MQFSVRRWLALAVSVAMVGVSVEGATLGKVCGSNRDCPEGSSCVAGDSEVSVQRCVAGTPCGGSNLGACPGDELSGQLACIWRPDAKCSTSSNGCVEIEDEFGIYKCISLDRCDQYFGDEQCSGSCNVNGKQCNGRGTCQLTAESTTTPQFECACETGWNGTRCDNVIDDTCMVDVGQCGEHGTCVRNACSCKDGYTGVQCQIPPESSESSSGSVEGSSSGSPVPSPPKTPTSAPNNSASKAGAEDGIEDKGSSTSALVIIMAILVALIVVGAIIFVVLARRRRRQQEAADQSNFNRSDSVLAGGDVVRTGPPTPKQKIVIM